jgi:hypothetical protein
MRCVSHDSVRVKGRTRQIVPVYRMSSDTKVRYVYRIGLQVFLSRNLSHRLDEAMCGEDRCEARREAEQRIRLEWSDAKEVRSAFKVAIMGN